MTTRKFTITKVIDRVEVYEIEAPSKAHAMMDFYAGKATLVDTDDKSYTEKPVEEMESSSQEAS